MENKHLSNTKIIKLLSECNVPNEQEFQIQYWSHYYMLIKKHNYLCLNIIVSLCKSKYLSKISKDNGRHPARVGLMMLLQIPEEHKERVSYMITLTKYIIECFILVAPEIFIGERWDIFCKKCSVFWQFDIEPEWHKKIVSVVNKEYTGKHHICKYFETCFNEKISDFPIKCNKL